MPYNCKEALSAVTVLPESLNNYLKEVFLTLVL